ncbi:hypothetical protein [Antarctobacter sp.]|uniref:hypothetical protein n=1 Tax=Antarctobacter sp. TaxID=1872577 RepID=UPI003A929C7D
MVSSSKILTVSYGTFSCTAEGFDDPMEVVKETTHFFRGVVGEDRFFGAEPPQFDPELATEYLRDRMADTGGTLSLGSPPRVMAAAASAGAMAAAMKSPAAHTDDQDALLPDDDTIEATAVLTETLAPDVSDLDHEAVLDHLVPDGPEAAPAPLASAPDDIAAKLDRIRAVVAQTAEEDAEDDAPEMAPEMTDVPDEAPVVESAETLVAEPVVEEPLVEDSLVEDPLAEAALFDETPEELSLPDEAPEDDTPEEEARDDALESLLGELVVESGEADAADLTDDIDLDDDDLDDDDFDDDAADSALDAAVASLMASNGNDDAPAGSAPIAAAVSAVAALAAGQSDDDDDDAPETAELDAFDALDETDITDSAHRDTDHTAAPVLGRNWAAEGPMSPRSESEPAEIAETPAPAHDPAPQAPQPHVRARVVKVKRAAFEQAIDNGILEEIEDDAPPPPAPKAETSSLSPDEEEELARELAAVKAELASDFGAWDDDDADPDPTFASTMPGIADVDPEADEHDTDHAAPLRLDNPIAAADTSVGPDWDEDRDEEMQSSARKAVKLASPARALLTEREVKDDDTSRLMDQTDNEMDEPEGNRRRSAIAHLRAAVAATKADRLLGKKADAAEEQEPYREDLASVVRPRRPQSVSRPTERPEAPAEAPTPLKLVAEQRVVASNEVAPAAETGGPVRPRRVRRTEPAPAPAMVAGDTTGFAAFAEDVGVKDLPELLEAAAAYMSYVEGRDQFSRPQLMTTLRQAELTDSSREDRLRSFGQLLREGKIRKTSGGRFTAAETISFKPAANG